MTALLPCPLCGARAVFGEINDPESENHGGIFIECTNCIITTDLRFSVKEDARPLLAEQWNKRRDGRERFVKIARDIKEQAEAEASGVTDPDDVIAASCWADCAAQILWEIEHV